MQDLGMNTYRVGGAVRDTLLGLPIHETDWVVVGGSAEQMRAAGFTQVGRDFPVFLHPETKEEFALARTERKSGPGHQGFEVHASPSVTLEEDLQRRDLTVNAMAMSEDGTIIDPYGGQRDLQERILRHVSPHFVEDPLRVLRVARFAARYHHLGFSVARETLSLMAEIVTANELARLSAERVWVETEKALGAQHPEVYWQVLDACGALAALAPELAALAAEAQDTSAPIVRHLMLEWPEDTETWSIDDQFLLGMDLLVAPITQTGMFRREVYIPAGTWYDVWTGEALTGPDWFTRDAPIGSPPVFSRDADRTDLRAR